MIRKNETQERARLARMLDALIAIAGTPPLEPVKPAPITVASLERKIRGYVRPSRARKQAA